jgi:hypothetical protein
MPELRRVFTPPKDAQAEPVCLLNKDMLADRAEDPTAFFAAARSQETLANGTVFRFAAEPGTWERVERFIADERDCCPFFAFEQWEERGEVVLRITREEESGTDQPQIDTDAH